MKLRLALLIVSLAIGVVGSRLWAQARPQSPPAGSVVTPGMPYGEIISGADIGFQRLGSMEGPPPAGKIYGRLMVRVDGKWLVAEAPLRMVR